jgi:CDP-2,3-bis-(O-geranylgeranyl)-sn-glycerol synthase
MLLEMARVLYCFCPAYAADVTPVLVKRLWPALARPVDGGRTFRGQPVFGSHKTWRGMLAGTAAGMIVYEIQVLVHHLGMVGSLALVDYSARVVLPGFLLAFGALLGDLVKSFFKRRVGIGPGRSWLGFDQLDFFIGASLLVLPVASLPPLAWLAVLPIVFLCDVAVCVFAYWLGLKESWI